MSTTIRRNAFGKIAAILRKAEFIRVYHYDDMGDDCREVDMAEVLDVGKGELGFSRVYQDESGTLHLIVHQNWCYTAYPTRAIAAQNMTAIACRRYNLPERYAPDFREQDCSGVFDGFSIVSDADPGL